MRHCAQDHQLGYHLTVVFRGPRFQSISLTHWCLSPHIARPARSWLTTTYPDAPSSGAITGLSYTGIFKGCPLKYRAFQSSPHAPSASRHSHQPTCGDEVVPFRAPLHRDFHPFAVDRVGYVTISPVSVSPNPRNILVGLSRTEYFNSERSTFAAPAQLRARGFGGGIASTG